MISEGKFTNRLLMKSRAAIFMASIPRLAPLVPAPISDRTSMILMLRMGPKITFSVSSLKRIAYGEKKCHIVFTPRAAAKIDLVEHPAAVFIHIRLLHLHG